MLIALTTLTVGVACLFAGGHALVRGASQLALRLELSPLFIGLTVVAFGTSLPELLVTVLADLRGAPEIAVGNVVGSNIANLGLVLGTAALAFPLLLDAAGTLRHLAASIGATLLAGLFFLNGILSRIEAALLLLGLVTYVTVAYRYARRVEGISDRLIRFAETDPESDTTASLLDGRRLLFGTKDLSHRAGEGSRQFAGSQLVIELFDVKDHVVFDHVGDGRFPLTHVNHIESVGDQTPRILLQFLALVDPTAQLDELGERSLNRDRIGQGDGAEVVNHQLDAGVRLARADADRLRIQRYDQRRRPVLEVFQRTPFLGDPLSVRGCGDPPLAQAEIDVGRHVICEDHQALPTPHARLGYLTRSLHTRFYRGGTFRKRRP